MKFGRRYTLSVETTPDASGADRNTVIDYPGGDAPGLTVEFEIRREFLSSSQDATFRIYDLSETSQGLIQKEWFEPQILRALQFRAGYEEFNPLIFNGTISSAYSKREGEDNVTTIEGYDGAFSMLNGYTNLSVGAGQSASSVITALATQVPALAGTPLIGSFPTVSPRGQAFVGNPWNHILRLTNGYACIDNGQLKALNPNEVIDGVIPLIDSADGLLESPQRMNRCIVAKILFEPRITVGQVVQLQSTTEPLFNGTYKVMGFTHRGVISPRIEGKCVTEMNLLDLGSKLIVIPGAPFQ